MGYSGRYHAASLAAVFIALAIGILIGIGLADDVVSTASQELEDSLREERDLARDEVLELQADVDQEQQFSEGAYPALVSGRLARQSVAVIELGEVPQDDVDDTANEAIEAVEESGGDLASVSAIPLPPGNLEALLQAAGPRFASGRRDPRAIEALGRAIGADIPGGGQLIERVKPELFATFNGSLAEVTRVVMIRGPAEVEGEGSVEAKALEAGIIEGVEAASRGSAGVERSSTDPPTLSVFFDLGVSTVDHVDLPAGKVSLIYVLDGADGDYGTKEGAASYLPELLPRLPAR